ncbi:MAG: formylmethanofuran dehydrogenase subunit B [Planctomycetaceae bacterium]
MQRFTDVACTACGCVCDDLVVDVDEHGVVPVAGACRLAQPWFEQFQKPVTSTPQIKGRKCSHEQAIEEAARILKASHAPLIYGLSQSSTGGQRAAVALADQLGAVIDTTASVCHGPSIVAIQQVGESTCTLGEIKQRADLVIFWGANPAVSHPRHMERYSAEPCSEFLPDGRGDRTVVVIDVEETETAHAADVFHQVEPEQDFELIWRLRSLIAGHEGGEATSAERQLADLMKNCRYGVIFFGLGIAQSHLGHGTVSGLLRLVAELNAHTRFTARRMRIPGDVSGADSVLCWQTGYPFAVDFSRKYPRYNPDEFTANELLERRDVDACLLVGIESVREFSEAAQDWLSSIPVIALDTPAALQDARYHVQIPTATYGIHEPGTAYRMDETPIPLRKLVDTSLPSDEQVLTDLCRLVVP